jgi:hypothetical protein
MCAGGFGGHCLCLKGQVAVMMSCFLSVDKMVVINLILRYFMVKET